MGPRTDAGADPLSAHPQRKGHVAKVLVTAATEHGATADIAQTIGETLAAQGLATDVKAPAEVTSIEDYDAVVLGSAVYAGHWLQPVKDLVHRSAGTLSTRPVWLFSSGPVGDPERKLVQKMGADPVDLPDLIASTSARGHRMFAGRLDRKDLPFAQRAALSVVRGLEGDFRDWDEIRAWATEIAAALTAGAPPGQTTP